MQTPDEKTGNRDDVLQEIAQQVLAEVQSNLEARVITISLCNVDLPAIISNGELYLQAPLPLVFDAFAAYISESFGILEARISEARRSALASAPFQPTVFEQIMAEQGMVRNGEES